MVATTTIVKSEAAEVEQPKEASQEEVKEKEGAPAAHDGAATVVAVSGAVAALDSEEKTKLTQEIARYF